MVAGVSGTPGVTVPRQLVVYKKRKRDSTNPEPAYGGKHCDGTGAFLRGCSNMSSCLEDNIKIAAFLISVAENFFVETKINYYSNKS